MSIRATVAPPCAKSVKLGSKRPFWGWNDRRLWPSGICTGRIWGLFMYVCMGWRRLRGHAWVGIYVKIHPLIQMDEPRPPQPYPHATKANALLGQMLLYRALNWTIAGIVRDNWIKWPARNCSQLLDTPGNLRVLSARLLMFFPVHRSLRALIVIKWEKSGLRSVWRCIEFFKEGNWWHHSSSSWRTTISLKN